MSRLRDRALRRHDRRTWANARQIKSLAIGLYCPTIDLLNVSKSAISEGMTLDHTVMQWWLRSPDRPRRLRDPLPLFYRSLQMRVAGEYSGPILGFADNDQLVTVIGEREMVDSDISPTSSI